MNLRFSFNLELHVKVDYFPVDLHTPVGHIVIDHDADDRQAQTQRRQ